ncbi:hypothetical protein [Kitasatospora cathayae]|uniref:Uncharacterized protein n=1 Tax=Kitasatospora cathayae TaxID=3004092 RepID=A0ABY7QGM5_9ACTN|nr:hypothetical protein [Kitasatospora sp. HUAS 3-15]WBP91903.1 hypothetical protein O1G21_01105 [Kitasatospora sp. HUAS 3-15]
MRELLDKIESRQRFVRETAEELREQIARLAEQLAAAEDTLKRLQITRETVLELAAEDGTELPETLPPGYRAILAAIETAGEGLRAKDVCRGPWPRRRATVHRRHPRQAETPGQPRHPHRTRARPLHPHQPGTDHSKGHLKLKPGEGSQDTL